MSRVLAYYEGSLMMRPASCAFSMNELMPQVSARFSNCSTIWRSGALAGDRITTE